jgi:hypothetical protein
MTEYHLLFANAGPSPATPQAVENALKAPDAPAVAKKMTYLHTADEGETTTHLWNDYVSGAEVRLVEDDHLECVYAVVTAEDGDDAAKVRDQLRGKFETITCDAVRKALKADMAKSTNLFVQLTLCGDDASPASEDLILDGLAHTEPTVRRAATTAAALLRTPRLIDEVDRLVDDEPDEAAARLMIGALRLAGRD